MRGRGETGEAVVRRCALGGRRRSPRELGQTLLVDLVRRGHAGAVPLQDAQADDDVLDQRRLVHLGVGEAREPRALGMRDRLRFAARGLERRVGDVECAHDFTPT